jgi:hypothetical protein
MTMSARCGIFRCVPSGEALAADDAAVLHDDAVADHDPIANGDLRVQDAVLSHACAGAHDDVRIDHGPGADRRARADRHERTDRHVRAELHVRRDRAGPVDAPGRRHRGHQQRHGSRKRQVRLIGAQQRSRRARPHHVESHDDRRRARLRKLRHIFLMDEERQIAGPGTFDAGNPPDLDVAVAFQTTFQPFGDLTQLHENPSRPA